MKKLLVFLWIAALLATLAACAAKPAPEPEAIADTRPAAAAELLSASSYEVTQSVLSERIQSAGISCRSGEKLYFLGEFPVAKQTFSEGEEQFEYDVFETRLVGIDETDGKLTCLKIYAQNEEDNAEQSTRVTDLFAGADDSVWVRENTVYYAFDLPKDFDEATQNRWDYYQYRGERAVFRNLAADGQTVREVTPPMSKESTDCCAAWGDTLLLAQGENLLFMDMTGATAGELALPGRARCILTDGEKPLVLTDTPEGVQYLYIDMETRTAEDPKPLGFHPDLIGGTVGGKLLCTWSGNVFSCDLSTAKAEKCVDWIDYGTKQSGVLTLWTAGKDDFWVLFRDEDDAISLLHFTKTPHTPSYAMTLAAASTSDDLFEQIISYNEEHPDAQIRLADYAEYLAFDLSPTEKLQDDLARGCGIDLVYSADSDKPADLLAQGKILDLAPYLDKDGELASEGGLLPAVRSALETDGKLYAVAPALSLHSAVAPKSAASGLTAENAEEKIPEGGRYAGSVENKASYFYQHLAENGKTYASGDREKIAAQLKKGLLISDLHREEVYDERPEWFMIRTGRQLLTETTFAYFGEIGLNFGTVGEDAVLCGRPDISGGHSLCFPYTCAVTASCPQPDAAWGFVRRMLLASGQADRLEIPTNTRAFENACVTACSTEYEAQSCTEGETALTASAAFTEKQAQELMHVLQGNCERCIRDTEMSNAVYAAVRGYFDGTMSLDDAVGAGTDALLGAARQP